MIDKPEDSVWDGVDHRTNTKLPGSKYKITYVRPKIYKQVSPIFNCVIPDSVLLANYALTSYY